MNSSLSTLDAWLRSGSQPSRKRKESFSGTIQSLLIDTIPDHKEQAHGSIEDNLVIEPYTPPNQHAGPGPCAQSTTISSTAVMGMNPKRQKVIDHQDNDESSTGEEEESDDQTPLQASRTRSTRSASRSSTPSAMSRSSSGNGTATRAKVYVCLVLGCQKAYSRPSRLAEHERVHTGERPYKCHEPGCSSSFRREAHFAVHLQSHSRSHPFICPQLDCTKAFITQDKLVRHLKIHDGLAIFPTPANSTKTTSAPPSPSPSCIISNSSCSAPTTNKDDARMSLDPVTLRRVAEEIIATKPYACTWEGCFKRFTKHQKLKAHVCMVHEGRKPYPCSHEGCDRSFQTPSKLRKHQLVHSETMRYGCGFPGCDSFFSKWSLLQKHNKLCHKSVPCTTCGKLVLKRNLDAHIKTHDPTRVQAPCTHDGCSKVFSTERTLATHIKKAHPKPSIPEIFKCEHDGCEKTFDYKHVLERHVHRVHDEPKPRKKRRDAIEASILDKLVGFTEEDGPSKLPFACSIPGCGRRFNTEPLLKRHLATIQHQSGDVTGSDVLRSMEEAANKNVRDMIELHLGSNAAEESEE